MINPYITGGFVSGSHFYGREQLIKIILHGLDANLWIIGNLFLAEWLKTSPTHHAQVGVTNRMLR
ncbi:MAG: hypothetical protein GY797_11520, partial [Deltaproteobacteria bacterium]|nr:hypothetical protein [Deltaproteobacteria bacterium]